MSDVGTEHEVDMQNRAAEAATGRQERRRWGPKLLKWLGIAGGALILAATLPHLLPAVAGWLASPLVAAGVPGIATAGTGVSAAAGVIGGAGLTEAVTASFPFLAKFAAVPLMAAGAYGLYKSIGPGARYTQALAK